MLNENIMSIESAKAALKQFKTDDERAYLFLEMTQQLFDAYKELSDKNKEIKELQEKIKQLEEKNTSLSAHLCPASYGDDGGHKRCGLVDSLEIEVKELNQKIKQLEAVLKGE